MSKGLAAWVDAKAANHVVDPAATRRAKSASRKATKDSESVAKNWSASNTGPEGRRFANAKAAESHLKAARAARDAGDLKLAEHHVAKAEEHNAASEQARDELGRFASGGGK